jgi:quinol monooxygenase YgiN
MNVAEGRAVEVETALLILIDKVREVPGCLGVDLLRDLDNERRFLFIEKWESVETHQAARGTVPQEFFAPIIAALERPSDGSYMHYLRTV